MCNEDEIYGHSTRSELQRKLAFNQNLIPKAKIFGHNKHHSDLERNSVPERKGSGRPTKRLTQH